jgi:hypothetical protein
LRLAVDTDRNQAVAKQCLTGSNAYWKWHTAYNRRSVAETAMYRALNKMTRSGMPKSVRIAWGRRWREALLSKSNLFNKAYSSVNF